MVTAPKPLPPPLRSSAHHWFLRIKGGGRKDRRRKDGRWKNEKRKEQGEEVEGRRRKDGKRND